VIVRRNYRNMGNNNLEQNPVSPSVGHDGQSCQELKVMERYNEGQAWPL
jgi:hypothetical protein